MPPFPEAEAVKKIDRVYEQAQPNDEGYGAVNQQLDNVRRVITAVIPHIETNIEFAAKPAILERLSVLAELDPISFEGVMVKIQQAHGDDAVGDLRSAVRGATSWIADAPSGKSRLSSSKGPSLFYTGSRESANRLRRSTSPDRSQPGSTGTATQ